MADFFGTIDSPIKGAYEGIGGSRGPVAFLSNIFQLIALVAGITAFFNLIMAGYRYIYANGDTQVIERANSQMIMSFVGLLIIVMSYTIAALLGWILFGRSDYFFNPQIYGPGA